jgi:uncharacterized protein involved in exopolysaccharide biosynthesis
MSELNAPMSFGLVAEISALIRLLKARIRWVAASVVAFSVLLVVVAFVTEPVYRADVVLAPARSNLGGGGLLSSALGQFGGLASLAGIEIGSSDAETEEALAVIQSRQFTEKFINDRQLMPKLFRSRWDAANETWKGSQKSWPTPAKAAKYFDKKIRRIFRDRKSGLITLQVDWRDRAEAAKWANDLAKEINLEMRRRAIANATAYVSYLEEEFKKTDAVATRDAISRLIESQVKQRMLATVNQEYAFQVVSAALPPDSNDFVKPRRLVLIAAGPVVGFFVALFAIILIETFRAARARSELAVSNKSA